MGGGGGGVKEVFAGEPVLCLSKLFRTGEIHRLLAAAIYLVAPFPIEPAINV